MKKIATIKIQGIKPLLFHAFKEEVLTQKKQSKSGGAGNNTEEWRSTVIMDEKRRLYLPNSYLFAPMREGGKHSKIGKGSIKNLVTATIEILTDKVFIEKNGNFLEVPPDHELDRNAEKDVYLDVRSVVNPTTKGRNLRYRIACSVGWESCFQVSWEDSVLSKDQIETVARDGGLLSGTGSGRSLGFGRFLVTDFSIS